MGVPVGPRETAKGRKAETWVTRHGSGVTCHESQYRGRNPAVEKALGGVRATLKSRGKSLGRLRRSVPAHTLAAESGRRDVNLRMVGETVQVQGERCS
eukprot:3820338-Rhodomonas_salina.2